MEIFKFHNTNPLKVLANGFLVKFAEFFYIKYELFKMLIIKNSRKKI